MVKRPVVDEPISLASGVPSCSFDRRSRQRLLHGFGLSIVPSGIGEARSTRGTASDAT